MEIATLYKTASHNSIVDFDEITSHNDYDTCMGLLINPINDTNKTTELNISLLGYNNGFNSSPSWKLPTNDSDEYKLLFDLAYISKDHFDFINMHCTSIIFSPVHVNMLVDIQPRRVNRRVFDSLACEYIFDRRLSASFGNGTYPNHALLSFCPPGWPDTFFTLKNFSDQQYFEWIDFLNTKFGIIYS